MNERQSVWLAYLRHELADEARAGVQEKIVTQSGFAEELADFEYRCIDAGLLPGLALPKERPWRLEILVIAALVLIAVLFVMRPVTPIVFIAAGALRGPVMPTVTLPRGNNITFDLELPVPPPGGTCTARGQTGPCDGPVFRITIPRPAPGREEIELFHNNQLVAVFVFTIE